MSDSTFMSLWKLWRILENKDSFEEFLILLNKTMKQLNYKIYYNIILTSLWYTLFF